MNQLFQSLLYAVLPCSLGWVLIAKNERGICAIFMGDEIGELVESLRERFSSVNRVVGDAAFEKSVMAVVDYIEKPSAVFPLPVDIEGTAFQKRVWDALMRIPLGETVSYTDVAKQIGAPMAMRAVAGACALNKLAVVVPCHRVVRQDGGLSGYRWGVERKRVLLEREMKKR